MIVFILQKLSDMDSITYTPSLSCVNYTPWHVSAILYVPKCFLETSVIGSSCVVYIAADSVSVWAAATLLARICKIYGSPPYIILCER